MNRFLLNHTSNVYAASQKTIQSAKAQNNSETTKKRRKRIGEKTFVEEKLQQDVEMAMKI